MCVFGPDVRLGPPILLRRECPNLSHVNSRKHCKQVMVCMILVEVQANEPWMLHTIRMIWSSDATCTGPVQKTHKSLWQNSWTLDISSLPSEWLFLNEETLKANFKEQLWRKKSPTDWIVLNMVYTRIFILNTWINFCDPFVLQIYYSLASPSTAPPLPSLPCRLYSNRPLSDCSGSVLSQH